jgi:hypothetical protein
MTLVQRVEGSRLKTSVKAADDPGRHLDVICTGGVRRGAGGESYRRCMPSTNWAGDYGSFCKAVRVEVENTI